MAGRRSGRTQEAVDEIVRAFKNGEDVVIAAPDWESGYRTLHRVAQAMDCDFIGKELRAANGGRVRVATHQEVLRGDH